MLYIFVPQPTLRALSATDCSGTPITSSLSDAGASSSSSSSSRSSRSDCAPVSVSVPSLPSVSVSRPFWLAASAPSLSRLFASFDLKKNLG